MLSMLMKTVGSKNTIMIGLLFEMLQLMWYGFGSQTWSVYQLLFIYFVLKIDQHFN
jgi:nitrate/nitrite transporter NarK